MGAGGNAAIETAATLANELKRMIDTAEKGRPSYDDIKTHLGNYQKLRDTRLTAVLKAANDLTRLQALATLKDKVFAYWVVPKLGDHIADLQSDMFIGSVKLDYLPTPERSLHGTMPFNPSQGFGQKESKLKRAAKGLPFLTVTVAAVYFMWGICLPHMVSRSNEVLEKGIENEIGETAWLKPLQSFYGVEALDSRIRGLAACFASMQFLDLICSWQSLTFLTDLGVVYSVLLVEGARRANIMTVSYLPLILGCSAQLFGGGVVMALWCLIHYIQTPIENFRARDMRLTDLSYSTSVLPVMLLAHYIPHLVSFSAWIDPQTRHIADWIWQPFPIWASALQYLLKKTILPDTIKVDRVKSPIRDLPIIKYTVYTTCAISATIWWYTLYNAPFSAATIFIPDVAGTKTDDEFVRLFMQFDEIFFMTACMLWLLYLFGDLKRAGMMDSSWISIVSMGLATIIVAGPGATFGLGWWWREQLLATKWHKDAVVAA
ncbi:hypothetical protein E8E13_010424 [Curvularia kusanoi]|uniref:Uncharacterized protein n=1 Tax=Curvularia kusanoi TaxID=90978 RepID=A0A9P4WDW3_CURKU|nr:hypothetical protein E8E13_010424 [Curvularia kusanoi]